MAQILPSDFRTLVKKDLQDTSTLEERNVLWRDKNSLLQWREHLYGISSLATEELKTKKEEYQSKLKKYSKNYNDVTQGLIKPADPQFLQKEQGKFEEYESELKRFEKEVQKNTGKIEAKLVLINEKLLFYQEQEQKALQEYIDEQEQIQLLILEDQEKVRNDLLLNWHTALRRGFLLGAAKMYKQIEQGSDPIEAYANIQKFFDGPLAEWKERPDMALPIFEEWLKNENHSQEEIYVD